MPYCNWCQLESDTPDGCVWCKRPFTSAPSVFGGAKRTNLHLLQGDDEPDIPVPIFAFVGVVVFVGIVVFAIFAWHTAANRATTQQAPAQNTLNWHFSNIGSPPSANAFTPQGPAGQTHSLATQLPGRAQSGAGSPSGGYGTDPGHGIKSAAFVSIGDATGDLINAANKSSIYVQSADFQLNAGSSHPALTGTVVVVNDSLGTIDGGKLWLEIDGTKYNLARFQGAFEHPRLIGPFAIASKDSLECQVIAQGYDGKSFDAAHKTVGLDAESAGAPVHVETPFGT